MACWRHACARQVRSDAIDSATCHSCDAVVTKSPAPAGIVTSTMAAKMISDMFYGNCRNRLNTNAYGEPLASSLILNPSCEAMHGRTGQRCCAACLQDARGNLEFWLILDFFSNTRSCLARGCRSGAPVCLSHQHTGPPPGSHVRSRICHREVDQCPTASHARGIPAAERWQFESPPRWRSSSACSGPLPPLDRLDLHN